MDSRCQFLLNLAMVSDALVDLVSGSAGGVANVLVGQPMDTVKVCFAISYGAIRYHVLSAM